MLNVNVSLQHGQYTLAVLVIWTLDLHSYKSGTDIIFYIYNNC